MANNRMFLVNRRTGYRICLAKYYPSTGWAMRANEKRLNEAFDENAAVPSMGGDTDWAIEYEITEAGQ